MKFYGTWRPIKAMTFDLDDTLYDNLAYVLKAEQAMLQWLHAEFAETLQTDSAFWRKQRNLVLQANPVLANDMVRLRQAMLYKGLLALGIPEHQAKHGAERGFHAFDQARSDFQVTKPVLALLAQLAERIPLVAITNGNVNIQRVGLAPYFRQVYHANIHQRNKPHPDMFALALKHLALPAEQVLHVGDHLINDVWGAYQMGMPSAWYAADRNMNLQDEPVRTLPTVQLDSLSELLQLVE